MLDLLPLLRACPLLDLLPVLRACPLLNLLPVLRACRAEEAGRPIPPQQLRQTLRLGHMICYGLRCHHMLQFRQATNQAFGSFDS